MAYPSDHCLFRGILTYDLLHTYIWHVVFNSAFVYRRFNPSLHLKHFLQAPFLGRGWLSFGAGSLFQCFDIMEEPPVSCKHRAFTTYAVFENLKTCVIFETVFQPTAGLFGSFSMVSGAEAITADVLTAIRGTASCQLSNAKCMTASVYPQTTQLLRLAVRPSNTLFPISRLVSEACDRPPSPRSRYPSLSTAAISFLIHSERS